MCRVWRTTGAWRVIGTSDKRALKEDFATYLRRRNQMLDCSTLHDFNRGRCLLMRGRGNGIRCKLGRDVATERLFKFFSVQPPEGYKLNTLDIRSFIEPDSTESKKP